MADIILLAKIRSIFSSAANRVNLVSGEDLEVSLGKISKWLSDLKTVAFTGSYNDLTDKPTIPSSAVTGVKGDDESSYRDGNVNITKSNIGLGNVQNKSSATIRSEITSSNVTNALGYTPVNKAGDNISGTFNFAANTVFNYKNGTSTEATIELDSDNCLYIDSSNPLYVSGAPVIIPTYFNIENISSLNDDESAYVLGSVWLTDDDYRQGRVVRITNESLFNRVFNAPNPQSHASIFRGKYLGSSFTSAQKMAIANGTFDDLFVGDYWTIGGVNWRIADIDYINSSTHHLIIMPDTALYNAKFNTSNTSSSGYAGSNLYSGLSTALSTINSAFGSSYIMEHSALLTNAVSGGVPTGWSNYNVKVNIPTQSMLCGHRSQVYTGNDSRNDGCNFNQLNLFRLAKKYLSTVSGWTWTSDCVAMAGAAAYSANNFNTQSVTNSYGVRPYFCLKGA